MRVALADDSSLFRHGLSGLLTAAGIEVTVQARSGVELLSLIGKNPADAAILDMRMPPTFTDEGLRTAQALAEAHPGMGLLVLSTYGQPEYAAQLLTIAGSGVGYLLKDRVDDLQTLTAALARVTAGESVVDPGIVTRLFQRQRHLDALQQLTPREEQVLRLMAEGRSNAGIAQHIHVSAKTVEAHVASMFAKLGLHVDATDNRRVLAVLTWLRGLSPAE